MTDAAPVSAPAPILTTKLLLARVNHRLALLRGWLSHNHNDEPYWWARKLTVPAAQLERLRLRWFANLLHTERASQRGHLHGRAFTNVDEQRAWLAKIANEWWPWNEVLGLPANWTLHKLREGKLLL